MHVSQHAFACNTSMWMVHHQQTATHSEIDGIIIRERSSVSLLAALQKSLTLMVVDTVSRCDSAWTKKSVGVHGRIADDGNKRRKGIEFGRPTFLWKAFDCTTFSASQFASESDCDGTNHHAWTSRWSRCHCFGARLIGISDIGGDRRSTWRSCRVSPGLWASSDPSVFGFPRWYCRLRHLCEWGVL